jgi:hypothetical protein
VTPTKSDGLYRLTDGGRSGLNCQQTLTRGWWPLMFGLLAGCGGDASPSAAPSTESSTPTIAATAEAAPPGVVELTSAKAKFDADMIVRFEIAYKFTSGSPVKNYLCEITFPGTDDRGIKPMDPWEVKPEGVIKTGIQVSSAAVKEFSITFAEADSPDRGYKVISNTLTGTIKQDPLIEPSKTGE